MKNLVQLCVQVGGTSETHQFLPSRRRGESATLRRETGYQTQEYQDIERDDVVGTGRISVDQPVGLGDEVGSLKTGKQADLILVDLTALNLSPVLETPVRNILPNLVYAGSGHEVKTAMVAGKVLVRDGEMLIADEAAVRAGVQVQAEEVARRVAADPVHKEMALLEAMEKDWL